MFTKGETYRRRDLHNKYGGQEQGGISTPSKHQFIMIFAGPTGEDYGYKDGWTQARNYLYTGEGQLGDMQFIRGNLAIRDHLDNGKDIHLFHYVSRGYVQYVGRMQYASHQIRDGKDKNGGARKVIVFELDAVD